MVSCVIPTKNRCSLLKRALNSVLNQTGEIPEIVVVDDDSSDNTLEMLQQKYPMVRVEVIPGLGPGEARNAGVEIANGDIIMFLDSDDEWFPGHSEALKIVIETGYEIAYGVSLNIDQVKGSEFLIPDLGKGISGDCFHALAKWCFMVPSAFALTRKAFHRIGGFNSLRLGEDWTFFIRLSALFPFGFSSELVSKRYLHSGSICSNEDIQNQLLSLFKYMKNMLSLFERIQPAELAYIDKVIHVIQSEGKQWKTFQDFYLALKEKKIL